MEVEVMEKVETGKKRRKIWAAVVAGVAIFIAGFIYHIGFQSFDVRGPALTEREGILAMGTGPAWLFELNPGNYKFNIYHYQYGYLVNVEDFTLLMTGGYESLLVEQRDFVAIRAARERDEHLTWNMSARGVMGRSSFIYDISELGTMSWGTIGNSIRLGDNEMPILFLSVSNGTMFVATETTIFSPSFRFEDHVEGLAEDSNNFIVSIRRVD